MTYDINFSEALHSSIEFDYLEFGKLFCDRDKTLYLCVSGFIDEDDPTKKYNAIRLSDGQGCYFDYDDDVWAITTYNLTIEI